MINSGRDGVGFDSARNPEDKKEEEDLEISDQEAPDVEEAKRNLRSQAEKKRKTKKAVV